MTSKRELRSKPRLIVNTGQGKGKSTAAFGIALRSWAQGMSVGVFYFIKSKKWRSGERLAFDTLNRAHEADGVGGPIEWHTMGAGWTWRPQRTEVDHGELAREGWREVKDRLAQERHDLYVLDEFNHVLRHGWVDVAEFLEVVAARPGKQHIVTTGRGCPQPVIDAADLVTEMTKIKHPFDQGEPGQSGIEW